MSKLIEALWTRLQAALAKHAPAVLESLGKPAKAASVAKLEAEFGMQIPGALKRSWAIHDGQDRDDDSNLLFVDFPFFSVAAVREEMKQMRVVAKSLGTIDDQDDFVAWHALVADGVGTIDGPVKARDFNPKWLPIGSVNGNIFRYIDLDPAPGGTLGQVIEVDPEGVSWRVVAASFAALLERFTVALEAGQLGWDDPDCGLGALFVHDDAEAMPAYLAAHAPPAEAAAVAETAPVVLAALAPGQSADLSVEVSRIMGSVGGLGVRLDLPDGQQVWADATAKGTKGYKQITMRARGTATLERLHGKKAAYVVTAFARRK